MKLGHVRSKTRSLGQILEKPCVSSRDHIFIPIFMKRGQNVCLDEFLGNFENGHVLSETRLPGPILEKPCVCSRVHIFSPVFISSECLS